jgi:hypothetical protein
MRIPRLLATLAASAACTMMLALVWRDPDPWHGPGQIAIVPLIVGAIGGLPELKRDSRLRLYAFVFGIAVAWAGLSAMMAPRAERWTALVIAVAGAIATVVSTWRRTPGAEQA